jgi:hypothetical protein
MNWDGSPTGWINGNDAQLLAYNNLFRGGSIMTRPYLSSQGDWIFRDNLFDKVVFVQDTAARLDHDHNGYWPSSSSELYFVSGPLSLLPRTSTLVPSTGGVSDSTTDKTLTAAPSYQASTFGNYYLSSTSPSLVSVGSRSPAAAGLFHFTTTPSQTKDGTQNNVNIGLHYVASSNGKAQDYDNDGIPDFVENVAGDGNYSAHVGIETDWQNAQTVSGTPDASNVIYDDVDLDGDGMVGTIERLLGKLPLVADNPLVVAQWSPGSESGIVTCNLPANYNALTALGQLQLLVDGKPAILQRCDQAGATSSALTWNTTYESPGHHFLQAELISQSSSGLTSVKVVPGPIAGFYCSNIAQFDEAFSQFDASGATLYARLPQLHATYTISLFDASGSLIRTLSGATTNGEIQQAWNVTYPDNQTPYTGDTVKAVFAINLTDSPISGESQARLNKGTRRVVPGGGFNVAFAFHIDNDVTQRSGTGWMTMQANVVDPLLADRFEWPVYESTFNRFSDAGHGDPGEPGYLPDRARVLNELLPNLDQDTFPVRNFYFHGHGDINTLYDGKHPPVAEIYRSDIIYALGNTYDPEAGIKKGKPYRFVFLDACFTAKANYWQHAFGIPDAITASQLQTGLVDPQAFVGWEGETILATGQTWTEWGRTILLFYTNWMLEEPLAACIGSASDGKSQRDGGPLMFPFPVPENAYKWADHSPKPNLSRIKIGGYAGIKKTGFDPGY